MINCKLLTFKEFLTNHRLYVKETEVTPGHGAFGEPDNCYFHSYFAFVGEEKEAFYQDDIFLVEVDDNQKVLRVLQIFKSFQLSDLLLCTMNVEAYNKRIA